MIRDSLVLHTACNTVREESGSKGSSFLQPALADTAYSCYYTVYMDTYM